MRRSTVLLLVLGYLSTGNCGQLNKVIVKFIQNSRSLIGKGGRSLLHVFLSLNWTGLEANEARLPIDRSLS